MAGAPFGTHDDECWRSPGRWSCAVARVELLEEELAECKASRIGDEWAGVEVELEKQVEKWGVQHHPDGFWHLILAEEVGEVARAILQRKRGEIEAEIVQCAAVCLAWLKDRAGYNLEVSSE